jgi:hypothetical protein
MGRVEAPEGHVGPVHLIAELDLAASCELIAGG